MCFSQDCISKCIVSGVSFTIIYIHKLFIGIENMILCFLYVVYSFDYVQNTGAFNENMLLKR